MAERYNGWTNYETWCVKLWMDNDEGQQRYWQEQAAECVKSYEGPADAVPILADLMSDDCLEAKYRDCKTKGVFEDLLNAALAEVNWHEIARAHIEGVPA